MWVKICANTNLEDALLAAKLGADAVGFVFAPSPRQVTLGQVRAITQRLPPQVDRVGVFPAWNADRIASTVAETDLTAIQLHAAFDADLVRSLRKALPTATIIIQAVHWQVGSSLDEEAPIQKFVEQIEDSGLIDHILVDSKVGKITGGTGTPFNWAAAETFFHAHPSLILAGGLQPRNVRQAIARLNPWGVDVASGVEAEAGRKDPEKLKLFIGEAR